MKAISGSGRLTVLAAAVMLGAGAAAFADDLSRTVEPGPVNTAIAGDDNVENARTALDAANAHVSNVSSSIDVSRRQAREIRERLLRADSALPKIKAKIEEANNRLIARRQEMAVEDTRYAPLKFADDNARLEAIGQFETSAASKASLKALNDSAAALRSVEAESLKRLSAEAEYQEAWNAVQTADAAVNAAHAKNPASADAIASTQQAADAAHQHLENLKRDRLGNDPNVAVARARVTTAKADLDARRKQFAEQDLPKMPKVAQADAALAGEQAEYDKTAAAAHDAEQQLADAKEAEDRQEKGLAADRLALDQITTDIIQGQTALQSAQSQADHANAALTQSRTTAQTDEQARENAAMAQQQQQSYSPALPVPYQSYTYSPYQYQYAPPPVVYGQPSYSYGAYTPGFYGGYGTVVVGPSFGFGFYGGNHGYSGHADFHHPGAGYNSHGGHGGGHR